MVVLSILAEEKHTFDYQYTLALYNGREDYNKRLQRTENKNSGGLIEATILAKSLGTLLQKHRKFAHSLSTPYAVLI